jgi:hypothetical protein
MLAGMTLVLSACGGEGEEAATQASTSPGGTTTVPLPEIEEPPPTAKHLVGTWSRTGSSTLFRFNADGTFAVDTHRLDVPYYAEGTYANWTDPRSRFATSGPRCADAWEWQTGIVKAKDRLEDELHIVFLDEGCDIPTGAEWTLARVPG